MNRRRAGRAHRKEAEALVRDAGAQRRRDHGRAVRNRQRVPVAGAVDVVALVTRHDLRATRKRPALGARLEAAVGREVVGRIVAPRREDLGHRAAVPPEQTREQARIGRYRRGSECARYERAEKYETEGQPRHRDPPKSRRN